MAQKVTVALIDDLDGHDAEETVTFGLDGKAYEIDLSASNARKLRAARSTILSPQLAAPVANATRTRLFVIPVSLPPLTGSRIKPSGTGHARTE
jgi:hypothetical protein